MVTEKAWQQEQRTLMVSKTKKQRMVNGVVQLSLLPSFKVGHLTPINPL